MKVKIKRLVRNKWENVPVAEFKGMSLCDFLLASTYRCVIAMYPNGEDKPVAFFCNRSTDIDTYKEKGCKAAFHARDVKDFLGEPINAAMYVQEFEGAEFIEMGALPAKEKKEKVDTPLTF